MPWGRLDDKANDNPKLRLLSDAAWRMWGCGLIYSQAQLTDGFIPAGMIHEFGVKARNRTAVAEELCQALVPGRGPLWHKVEGGYQIHDYLDWNDSRDKVIAAREGAERRLGKFRDRRKGERRTELVNVLVQRVSNAVRDALHNGVANGVVNATPTYHVPQKNEKQERADAYPHPVENVERLEMVRRNRRKRSRETDDGRPKLAVITAVARDVVRMNPHEHDEAELRELVKVACSEANLKYDGQSVGAALETARAQVRRSA